MNALDRRTVAASLAVLLAASALVRVFDGAGWIVRTVLGVAVVAGAGSLSRRTGVPRPLQPVVGLLALVAYVVVVFVGATLRYLVVPGVDTVTQLRDLVAEAGADLALYAPPAPTTPALVLLAVLGVGAAAALVDALAVSYGKAALAGLPLLLLFAVPSGLLPGGLGWVPFALGSAGWLGLLLVEGQDRVGRWGAPLRPGPDRARSGAPRSGEDPTGLGRVGRRIGLAALGVAVLVPATLPGLDERLFPGSGTGGGAGGTRRVETYNPITTLRGQLDRLDPVEVLRYRTDDQEPDYLRMTTLGEYDGGGWRQGELTASPDENRVQDQIPRPLGTDPTTPSRSVTTELTLLGGLDAFWLPVPATPTRVQVDGPWLWDEASQSVFATRARTDEVRGYTVSSTRLSPQAARLAEAGLEVPGSVLPYAREIDATDDVRALTTRVVGDEQTAYGKAAALQRFFLDPEQEFEYSEQTEQGTSPDALQAFLEERRGFCQQYASAMAAMLRLSGVPSRVAVGYTSGVRQPDGDYLVTTEEAHAWPEAWIAGAGWVRFEPTPPDTLGRRPPDYGVAPAPAPSASASGGPTASAAPTGPTGETAADRARRLAAEARQGTGGGTDPVLEVEDGGVPWRAVGLGALLLALLGSPAALHDLRRRRRWRDPGPAPAWEQVRDDAADLGHRWEAADSPRRAAARLRDERELPEPAAAALTRLSCAVERDRYAPPGRVALDADDLHADVTTLRRGLLSRASRGARLRARLLPPSTLRWASSTTGQRTADLLDEVDGRLSASRRWLRERLTRR